jgi:hypothetical protein
MTDYLAIARECGAHVLDRYDQVHFSNAALSAFAEQVRQDERERCAAICLSLVIPQDAEPYRKTRTTLAAAILAQQVPERAE